MSRHTSKSGQRVDKVAANADPHDLYRGDGTPVLLPTKIGQVMEKSVTEYTVSCPECDVSGRYDEDSEPVCPECGLLLAGAGERTLIEEQLVRDAKAAGRISDDYT